MNPHPNPDEVALEGAELDDDESWRDEDEEIGYSDGVPVDDVP